MSITFLLVQLITGSLLSDHLQATAKKGKKIPNPSSFPFLKNELITLSLKDGFFLTSLFLYCPTDVKNKTLLGLLSFYWKCGRMLRINPWVSCQLGMAHLSDTTRKPKLVSLAWGRMTNANSSGGGQGCLTHGWLLLLLSSLQRHHLLESFLPTHLYSAAGMCTRVPAEPPLSLGGFGTMTPPYPFPSCIFFFPPTLSGSRGFQCCGRITPGRDVTVLR